MIPYGRQSINQADIDAVEVVLRSDFLTQGPAVPRFEAALAAQAGASRAVAVNSATSALHLAYLALGLGDGDTLWTSPITFVATANAARLCGAEVDFVDIDPTTGNMCVEALAAKLERAEMAGTRPKIVVPVHFAGQPCDMVAIAELSERYGFHVVEDAAHAIGAGDETARTGACAHSDITVYSFHPVKIITTGEGGAALTNNEKLAANMERLRSHGITRNLDEFETPSDGGWSYQQIELGLNYRMTDMAAALGLSQLSRLDQNVARRAELADRYDELLSGLPVTPLSRTGKGISAWHLYVVLLDDESAPRKDVYDRMRTAGIGVQVHYIPVHHQPYYARQHNTYNTLPGAERYYSRALSIPLYPDLSEEDQDTVVRELGQAVLR